MCPVPIVVFPVGHSVHTGKKPAVSLYVPWGQGRQGNVIIRDPSGLGTTVPTYPAIHPETDIVILLFNQLGILVTKSDCIVQLDISITFVANTYCTVMCNCSSCYGCSSLSTLKAFNEMNWTAGATISLSHLFQHDVEQWDCTVPKSHAAQVQSLTELTEVRDQ